MHGDPLECLIEGGEQAHHLDGRILPYLCSAQALFLLLLQESSTLVLVMVSPTVSSRANGSSPSAALRSRCTRMLQDSVANCAIYIAGHKSIPS